MIPIRGIILPDSAKLFGQEVVSATDVVQFIKDADENPQIKAIIIEINSPGGAVVASEEIASAVKATNKTTVAYIREIGASGAYWAASAADYIFASRMSITGSVGVVASYLEFSGFLEDHNITNQRLVAGKYKDLGSPFKKMAFDEKSLFQKQLDLIHGYFLDDVAKGRNLSKKAVNKISTAQIFLGVEAKELRLIDEFGGREDAISYVEDKLNITAEVSELVGKKSILDVLSEVSNEKSFFVGRGIGSSLLDVKSHQGVSIWS